MIGCGGDNQPIRILHGEVHGGVCGGAQRCTEVCGGARRGVRRCTEGCVKGCMEVRGGFSKRWWGKKSGFYVN